ATVALIRIQRRPTPPHSHSFPTRRSSDLHPAISKCLGARVKARNRRSRHTPSRSNTRSGSSTAGTTVASDTVIPTHRSTRPSGRSEEHTSELQSRGHLVCRLLLEKKNSFS